MNSGWRETTLQDAGIILIDCDHKTPAAQEVGIPYIGIPQLKEGHIKFELNPRLITEEDFIKWTTKAYPQYNDVILSRRCNPGVTAHVPEDVKFALGQNLVLLRSVGNEVDRKFLRWLTSGRNWWGQVEKFLNVGAVFDSLRCRDIPKFKINLPPLPEQKAIAHILCRLDDKIELNRKMNETLEAMAQALFKSWFVDFDPVIDKALASGHDIPEELQAKADRRKAVKASGSYKPLPEDIQKLFPAAFEYNEELGKWIPEGWENGCLKDICNQRKDNAKLEDIHDEDCYVGLEHIDRKIPFLQRHGLGIDVSSNKSRFINRDILFGKLRPYFHKVCISRRDGICSTDILVFYPKMENHHSYVFSILFSKDLIDHVNICSTGTRMPRANAKDILNYSIVYSNSVIEAFDKLINNNWIKGNENVLNSDRLEKNRDLLLSQLISGKTRLPKSFIEQFENKTAVAS